MVLSGPVDDPSTHLFPPPRDAGHATPRLTHVRRHLVRVEEPAVGSLVLEVQRQTVKILGRVPVARVDSSNGHADDGAVLVYGEWFKGRVVEGWSDTHGVAERRQASGCGLVGGEYLVSQRPELAKEVTVGAKKCATDAPNGLHGQLVGTATEGDGVDAVVAAEQIDETGAGRGAHAVGDDGDVFSRKGCLFNCRLARVGLKTVDPDAWGPRARQVAAKGGRYVEARCRIGSHKVLCIVNNVAFGVFKDIGRDELREEYVELGGIGGGLERLINPVAYNKLVRVYDLFHYACLRS